jgi:hypothetical protein
MIPLAIALFVLTLLLVVVPPKLLIAVPPLKLTKSMGPPSCCISVSSVDVCVRLKLGTPEFSSDTDATAVDGSPSLLTIVSRCLVVDFAGGGGGS